MTSKFDRDTAVRRNADGSWSAEIARDWWIVDGPNGGTIAAILLRAIEGEVDDAARWPRTLTVHYLRRPAAGAALVHTTLERSGRAQSTVSARLLQDDRLVAFAIAACSLGRPAPEFCDLRMPEVSPPEQCPTRAQLAPNFEPLPFHRQWEVRPALGAAPRSGSPSSTVGGWLRLAEPRPADAILVAQLADAWTPAIFPRMDPDAPRRAVPTIELTVHFREPDLTGQAPDDWYFVCFRTQVSRDGFLEEDGEIWTRGGVLVAQSRQLAAFV